jgi:hypothetical protein
MLLVALLSVPSPEETADKGVKLLGIVVGVTLLLAAIRYMFGGKKKR